MTSAPIPQAVVSQLTKSAMFLVLEVETGKELDACAVLEGISGYVRSINMRSLDGELQCVTGIGSDFWDRTFTAEKPGGLHPFKPLSGATHTAPATPGDILLHIRAQRMDLCFELAHRVNLEMRGIARIVDEVHGFRYWDARDLLGFVDGTENPTGPVAEHFAFTDASDTYPASSYVIVQKYTHDMAAWDALSVEEQEAVFGRTKLSDVEFDDEDKASNSHLALNVVEDEEGNERKILRDNMPFGNVGDEVYGTYFIGYAADVTTTELMLENMFIGVPPGNHDRVLDFSTAVTGTLFFVPSQTLLDELSSLTGTAGGSTLGIGSLRDRPQPES